MIQKIIQLGSFPNPEYYKAQRMRLSASGKPRMIECAEEHADYVAPPRGCSYDIVNLVKSYDIELDVVDERNPGIPIHVNIHGELRPLQQKAANTLLPHECGVLSATTAFRKTVLAAYLIAERKVNTLILVHRKQLLEQWKELPSLIFPLHP